MTTQPHVRTTIAISFSHEEKETMISFLVDKLMLSIPFDMPDKYRLELVDWKSVINEIDHFANEIPRHSIMRIYLHVSHGERRIRTAISLYYTVNDAIDADSIQEIWDNSIQY